MKNIRLGILALVVACSSAQVTNAMKKVDATQERSRAQSIKALEEAIKEVQSKQGEAIEGTYLSGDLSEKMGTVTYHLTKLLKQDTLETELLDEFHDVCIQCQEINADRFQYGKEDVKEKRNVLVSQTAMLWLKYRNPKGLLILRATPDRAREIIAELAMQLIQRSMQAGITRDGRYIAQHIEDQLSQNLENIMFLLHNMTNPTNETIDSYYGIWMLYNDLLIRNDERRGREVHKYIASFENAIGIEEMINTVNGMIQTLYRQVIESLTQQLATAREEEQRELTRKKREAEQQLLALEQARQQEEAKRRHEEEQHSRAMLTYMRRGADQLTSFEQRGASHHDRDYVALLGDLDDELAVIDEEMLYVDQQKAYPQQKEDLQQLERRQTRLRHIRKEINGKLFEQRKALHIAFREGNTALLAEQLQDAIAKTQARVAALRKKTGPQGITIEEDELQQSLEALQELAQEIATTTLQKHTRGFLARRRYARMKAEHQAEQRRYQAQADISRHWRGYKQRQQYKRMQAAHAQRQHAAQTDISRHWRGYKQRQRYQQRQQAAETIARWGQRHFRGQKARQRFAAMKEQARQEAERRKAQAQELKRQMLQRKAAEQHRKEEEERRHQEEVQQALAAQQDKQKRTAQAASIEEIRKATAARNAKRAELVLDRVVKRKPDTVNPKQVLEDLLVIVIPSDQVTGMLKRRKAVTKGEKGNMPEIFEAYEYDKFQVREWAKIKTYIEGEEKFATLMDDLIKWKPLLQPMMSNLYEGFNVPDPE